MTDLPDKSAAAELEGPGAQLRRARERRGLLLHDIAQELHLDEWMLQALEEDDFAALGAPVFTKGHMRKYGDMLGLNSDDLMIAYYRKRGRDDSPPPITKIMTPESPGRQFRWKGLGRLFLALAAIVAIYLVWVLVTRVGGNDSSVSAPIAPRSGVGVSEQSPGSGLEPVPLEMTEQLPGATASDSPQQSIDSTGSAETTGPETDNAVPIGQTGGDESAPEPGSDPVNDAVPVTAVPVVDEPIADERIQIRLIMSGESWVEVTDSEGSRLLYAMMTAGRIRTVTGKPPIEVFLGLSRAVQVEVNGQSYSIPRSAIRGNTARFVIDSDSL